jgi:hypothetical protein
MTTPLASFAAFVARAAFSGGALVALGALGGAAGCGDDTATIAHLDASAGPDAPEDVGAADAFEAGFDGGAPLDASDASDASDALDAHDAPDTSAAGTGYMRLAHLSPDGPQLDLCLGPRSGGAFDFSQSAPLAKPFAPGGIGFERVSVYYASDAGDYALRFVSANAPSCATPLAGRVDVPITITNGGYVTVSAAGMWSADAGVDPFTVTLFVDDGPFAARVDGGTQALLRVIRETPRGGALDVGQNDLADANYIALFSQVQNHKTATPGSGGIDAHGYTLVLFGGENASVHVEGDAVDLAVWRNVVIDVGEVATMFLVPDLRAC